MRGWGDSLEFEGFNCATEPQVTDRTQVPIVREEGGSGERSRQAWYILLDNKYDRRQERDDMKDNMKDLSK